MSGPHLVGFILVVAGGLAYGGNHAENRKIPKRAWDVGELCLHYGGLAGVFLGLALLVFGCGASVPEPTDPVTVEVDGPTTELAPTVNFYLRLSMARVGFAACEAAQVPLEERSAIRAEARQEVQLLHDELVAYVKSGQTGEYCGPVCEEIFNFLANVDESICEE